LVNTLRRAPEKTIAASQWFIAMIILKDALQNLSMENQSLSDVRMMIKKCSFCVVCFY